MTTRTDRLVEDYLERLEGELADVPAARRRELVAEISEHIDEGRAELDGDSEAELRTLLDRIGEPEEIAAEARERFGMPPRQRPRGRLEVAALVLLLPGSLILSWLGWIVGVALLWMSEVWTVRDKLIGTLVVPGGLGSLVLLLFAGDGSGWLLWVVIFGSLVSTGYLAWRLHELRG